MNSPSADERGPTAERGAGRVPTRVVRLVAIAVVAVIVAGLAGARTLRAEEVYLSRTVLTIDQPVALAAATDGALLDKLSQLRVKYADLVPTPEIAGPAAEALGLRTGEVASAVSADFPPLSLTLAISARASEPTRAVEIANATAEALVDYVDAELDDIGVTGPQRYEFRILTPAVGAPKIEPTRDDALRVAVSFGLLALGAGYIGSEALEALRRRRTTPPERPSPPPLRARSQGRVRSGRNSSA